MKDKYFVQIYLAPDYIEETDTIEENVAVGTASFIEIYPMFISNHCVKIRLYDLDIPNEKVLEGLNLATHVFVMELCVPFSDSVYTVASIWVRIKRFFLPFGKTAQVEFYINTPLTSYNQNEADFIQQWATNPNEYFDWQSPATLNLYKQAYLRACLSQRENEILFSPDPNPIFTLQGDFVKDEDDFYILMGKAFFKNKGCMGINLNSLNSMLIEYWKAHKPIREVLKPTLILENYPHLLQTLGDNFMWHVDDIFNANRFLITKK